MRNTDIGVINFNNATYDISCSQPPLHRFQIAHHFSCISNCSDVKGMFCAIFYEYQSSLADSFFCYKTQSGYPTLVLEQSKDGVLYPLRNQRCSFVPKNHPAVSSYILKSTAKVFRKYHKMNDEETFLLQIVELTLKYFSFADDIVVQICKAHVESFLQFGGNASPVAVAPVNLECLEKDVCVSNGKCWNSENRNKYITFLDKMAQEMAVKTAELLIKVLNFSNFYLKMYDTNTHSIAGRLSELIKAQKPFVNPDRRVQVVKPSRSDLGKHIDVLLRRQITHRVDDPAPEKSPELQHLGHLVSAKSITLKDRQLSIKYLTKEGKQARSKSLKSYTEFIKWEQEVGPIFTKRTCFSLLCANADFSSSFLALYQALMKIVIREFLMKNPKALCVRLLAKRPLKS